VNATLGEKILETGTGWTATLSEDRAVNSLQSKKEERESPQTCMTGLDIVILRQRNQRERRFHNRRTRPAGRSVQQLRDE
jgi:hypothetical protein